MGTTSYACNGRNTDYQEWTRVGSSPYLDAPDYPANYIYLGVVNLNKREGSFGFVDAGAEAANTLTGVTVDLKCFGADDPDTGMPSIGCYVNDGASWYGPFAIVPGYSNAWVSVSVFSKINTWNKLNACLLYVKGSCLSGISDQGLWVDTAQLTSTWSVPSAGVVPFGDGLSWVGQKRNPLKFPPFKPRSPFPPFPFYPQSLNSRICLAMMR